ncbi:MAG: DNA-binding protein [Candidatus Thorarchaeota archaeon]
MNNEDAELAMLRRKKMAKLIAKEKKHQELKAQEETADGDREKLLKQFLDSEAKAYLQGLKKREPAVVARIEEIILYLVIYRQVRQLFGQIDVRYIERQIKGEESKIRIQRDGETSDFGSYVRDAIKKGNNDTASN